MLAVKIIITIKKKLRKLHIYLKPLIIANHNIINNHSLFEIFYITTGNYGKKNAKLLTVYCSLCNGTVNVM